MAQRKPEVVTVTVCDRCDSILTKTISHEETGKQSKIVLRETYGPVSFTIGGANGVGRELLRYGEICGRCERVIRRIVKKCGPVKRGGYRAKKKVATEKVKRSKARK